RARAGRGSARARRLPRRALGAGYDAARAVHVRGRHALRRSVQARETGQSPLRLRDATGDDAPAIAALHAESWRTTYRGALRDDYLDGHIVRERTTVWRGRLDQPAANQRVVVAE